MNDTFAAREWLRHWQFWILEVQFIALLVLTWINLPDLWRVLRPPRRSIAGITIVSMLIGASIVLLTPRTNRIYYDEQIYQGIAQNMADLHLAQMCNDGHLEYGVLECSRGEYNKEPSGYPYLLSIPFRVLGASEAIAPAVNVLCAVLLSWVVYLTTALLFGDGRAAVLAALILGMIPQQLVWSHTAAVEPSAALMTAVAVMTTVVYAVRQSWRSLLWMTLAIVCAVQFRIEAALVAVVSLVVIALYAPAAQIFRARSVAIVALGLLIGASHLVHLAAIRGENWGATDARLSLANAWNNLPVNGVFYIADARFPAVFTLLALAGVLIRPVRSVIVPIVAFALFFGIFVFFYAGSYNFGADVRFSLMSNPWLAVLAGRGLAEILNAADRHWGNDRRALTIAVALLLLQFSWYLPQVRATGEEAWAARADVEFARTVIPKLPPHSMVLTHNPSIFHLNGANAAQMSLAASEPYYLTGALTERFTGGIFLHWNAWCGYYDQVQRDLCANTLNGFDSQLIAEYRERDFRYAFYRLTTAGTIPKVGDNDHTP